MAQTWWLTPFQAWSNRTRPASSDVVNSPSSSPFARRYPASGWVSYMNPDSSFLRICHRVLTFLCQTKPLCVLAVVVFTIHAQEPRTTVPEGTRFSRDQFYFPNGLIVSAAQVNISAYFPRTVTECPYSANLVWESSSARNSETEARVHERDKVYRDSEGRTRTEVDLEHRAGDSSDSLSTFIEIIDPVAGFRYLLDPRSRTAQRTVWEPAMKADTSGPLTCAPIAQPPATNSIGSMIIEGIEAEGLRETRSYPRRSKDDPRPYSVVGEHWWAPDLKIYLLSKSSDERYGTTTVRVTDISREEPEAELFQVPPGYTLTE